MSAVEELEKVSDLYERLDSSAGGVDFAANLLEPIACFLGAETASFRSFSVLQDAPKLTDVVVLGIRDSVNDAYSSYYFKLDPARRLLAQRLARPLFSHRTRYGQWANEQTTRAMRQKYREEFLQYRREFLLPNDFCHHVGFCFQDPNGRTLLFDFHRMARSPEFNRLEHARARIVGVYLHLKSAQCPHVAAPHCAAEFDDRLSAREREVAEAVASGLSNKEVAADLKISVRTVENHMRTIFAKLNVTTRTRLVAKLREPVPKVPATQRTVP